MSPEEARLLIAEARERAEKATPGGIAGLVVFLRAGDDDAIFIAAARTDIPALCDGYEEAISRIAELERRLAHLGVIICDDCFDKLAIVAGRAR